MFKSRKKLIRKCRDRQFTDRGNGGGKKVEGNSNIPTKRLTIPPGFLCLGIKSETIKKRKHQPDINIHKECILKEDLHDLFNSNLNKNTSKPRRSSRISKKVEETENVDKLRASDYYSKILKQGYNSFYNKKSDIDSYQSNSPVKNNSKSLFREINKRCARIIKTNSEDVNYVTIPAVSTSRVEGFQVNSFCINLLKEIRVDLKQKHTLLDRKLAIAEKIQNINHILCGRLIPNNQMAEDDEKRKDNMENDREENIKNFNYVPKCQWVYETPPRQKILLPKVEECAIQPAVICTTKKQSNIYELNPNVKVDFNKYTNKQNVEIEQRYLRHLASFKDRMQIDVGLNSLQPRNQACTEKEFNNGDDYDCQDRNKCSSTKFTFENPFSNLPENCVLPTLSRPIKSIRGLARMNLLKRKIDELESTPASSKLQQEVAYLEGDITFVKDDGKFKIMNTQCLEEERNIRFQFKKNLFQVCGEDNVFSFNKDEQKMFDFSLLRKDDC